jgi:hypothetical protein
MFEIMKAIQIVYLVPFLFIVLDSGTGYCQNVEDPRPAKSSLQWDSTGTSKNADFELLILNAEKLAKQDCQYLFSYYSSYRPGYSSSSLFHKPSWNSRLIFEYPNGSHPIFRIEKIDLDNNSSLDFNTLSKQIKAPPLRFGNDTGNQQILYPTADYQSIGWGYLLYEIFSHNYSNHMFNLYNGKR